MSDQIVNAILWIVLGFAAYTIILAVARRRAGERGYLAAAAFMSVAWWLAIELGLALLSFYLSNSVYRDWFTSEPLERSPVFGGLFKGSGLVVADWMSLILTVLAFALAHGVVFNGMVLRQQLSRNEFQSVSQALPGVGGFAALAMAYGFFLLYWEAPVLALRTAELVGSADTDKLVDNIIGIQSIWQIVGNSWLLTTLLYLWPVLILFATWGFTRAYIALDNQLATVAGQPVAERGEAAAATETAQDAYVASPPAPVEAAAQASPRREPSVPATVARSEAPAEDGSVQDLLDQLEDERSRNAYLQQTNEALARDRAQESIWLPNRGGNLASNEPADRPLTEESA